MRYTPSNWYALGTLSESGWLRIRKLVSGRLMATMEKRRSERIVPVDIYEKAKKPTKASSILPPSKLKVPMPRVQTPKAKKEDQK